MLHVAYYGGLHICCSTVLTHSVAQIDRMKTDFRVVLVNNEDVQQCSCHIAKLKNLKTFIQKSFGKFLIISFFCFAIHLIFIRQDALARRQRRDVCGRRVQQPPAHRSTTHGGSATLSFLLLNVKPRSCKYQF